MGKIPFNVRINELKSNIIEFLNINNNENKASKCTEFFEKCTLRKKMYTI